MRTLAIVTMIIVLVVACMTAGVVLALLIRIQEHDQQIIDLRRDIRNCQQGGQELSARMNRIETNLN